MIGHALYNDYCIAVYDGDRMAELMAEQDDMTFEDAREYVAVNMDNVYKGPGAAMVVWRGPESNI